MAGKFISIEGGEGVGKSSFIQALESRLKSVGTKVVSTREPGGTAVAQQIRNLFMSPPEGEKLEPISELFLVSAARCQHITQHIAPALGRGDWVLCDRFHDSTRVYQGVGGGVPLDQLESVIKLSVGEVEPDLTFVLDCDVNIALDRIGARERTSESGNRYDQANRSFHEKLRSGFLDLQKRFPERVSVIDASQEPEKVLDEALDLLCNRFGVQV